MATRSWLGHAVTTKQAATAVVANTWAQNDTHTLTIDGLDFVITIGTLVTTAQVATTIKQAFNGETLTDTSASATFSATDGGAQAIPQFKELVASVNSSTVTFTARTAGKPFTMSSAVNTAGDGDITYTNAATANAGKHEADNADNWSGNTAPVDDDDVVFNEGSVDVKYDLTFAAQFASIRKEMTYTGNIGLPETNADTANYTYREYRGKYLVTDDNSVTTTADLETGFGSGSGRFKWDAGAGQVLLNVFGKGRRAETGVPCILFKGSNASNEVNNLNGDLGIAFFPGETATVATLRSGSGPTSIAETRCGSGTSLTTTTTNGGQLYTDSAITTANVFAGSHFHENGTVTTVNVNGGVFYPMADATLTTVTVGSDGTFDCRQGSDSFTITNTVQLYKGARFYDPQGRAGNIVFKLNQCTPADVTIVLAPNKTYTLS